MKTIVQVEAKSNIFNQSLQKHLLKNKTFSEQCNLVVLDLEDLKEKYAIDCKKRREPVLLRKIHFWGFNHFLENEYKDLKGEIVNIQSVAWKDIFILPFLKKHFSKIVLSFWGGDILRVSKRILRRERFLFENADIITFISEDMIEKFTDVFGDRYLKKIRKADFGSEIISFIDAICDEDIGRFRKDYNIPSSKKCIVVGYNRDKGQQHLEIIKSIIHSNINPDDCVLIFPWTYGPEDSGYLKQIMEMISDKYEYIILNNKLTDIEVACLRMISDILIQTQIADALSSSMLETLYAEKEVITGRWLHYDELVSRGVHLHYVDSVNDVGLAIKEVLRTPLLDESKKKNKSVVREMISWDVRIHDWIDIYLSK